MSHFQRATKQAKKLRLAVFGPSGAGKTYTALLLAAGLGGRTALIDSEHASATMYADRFEFDTVSLPVADIEAVTEMLREAAAAGYAVVIIDSMSHAWSELLGEIDQKAQAKYRGNTWSAWSEGTPKQQAFVRALLSYPGHVIATMRSKTEWSVESAGGGKTKPVRVGLAPVQGKGIEYEFDMLMEMSTEHTAHIIKDRTGKYQDAIIDKPGADFGASLAAWLAEGAEAAGITGTQVQEIGNAYKVLGLTDRTQALAFTRHIIQRDDIEGVKDLTMQEATDLLAGHAKGALAASLDAWARPAAQPEAKPEAEAAPERAKPQAPAGPGPAAGESQFPPDPDEDLSDSARDAQASEGMFAGEPR